jgi:RES domain-containing protein
VLDTSAARTETIPALTRVARAQIAFDWQPIDIGGGEIEEVPAPCGPSRMMPRASIASEGRANAKGIPVLYTATHRETAIAEVRPWLGLYVTVALIRIKRDLRIVNCTNDLQARYRIGFHTPTLPEFERYVWADINRAYSAPVNPNDQLADYAPTQVLAEYFRQHGFDGIAYASSLGPGHNLVLFDPSAAEVRACDLVEVTRVAFTSEQASNTYFIAEMDEHDAVELAQEHEPRPPDQSEIRQDQIASRDALNNNELNA